MDYNSYILLFIINLFIFLISFVLVFKRSKYSSVAIRSPKIIIISNICSFLLTSAFITYEMIEDYDNIEDYNFSFCNLIPFCYTIFHFSIFVSLIFRMHRMVQCCTMNNIINNTVKSKAKTFYSRRFLLDEQFYTKALTIFLAALTAILGLIYINVKGNIPLPYHFMKCSCNNEIVLYRAYLFYNIAYFFEAFAAMTYIYRIFFTNFNKYIKVELIAQLVIYILTFHFVYFAFNINDEPFHSTSMMILVFSYFNVVLNAYLPSIMSLIDKVKTSYHFNPKLTSNLFLFLSDEICYYSFSNFMKNRKSDNFYICLYTQIMKFKYKFSLEGDYFKIFDDAKALYENYFSEKANNSYMNQDLLFHVRSSVKKLINTNECQYEMFDEALVEVYNYLENKFNEYRKSDEYKVLVDNLNLNSYVQYKMCTVYNNPSSLAY